MIAIAAWGEGPPVVLVHGSPGNAQAWKAVAQRLAPRFRLLAPTLPGHDAPPAGPLTPVETAELAAAVEAALGPTDQPIVLAAHSYGGNVAVQLALRGRLPISRIVLFEPVTMAALAVAGADDAYAAAEAVFTPYVRAVEAGDAGAVSAMIDFWFGPGAFAKMPAGMQAHLRANAPTNARDVAATFRERLATADLKRIAAPALVVYGGASPPLAKQIATAIASNVANGRAVELPGANHAMLATHPAEIAALIVGELTPAQEAALMRSGDSARR